MSLQLEHLSETSGSLPMPDRKGSDLRFEVREEGKGIIEDPNAMGFLDTESDYYKHMTKRIVRKYDLWVMPMCMIIYIFSALDKGNLGHAKILGLVTSFGGDPSGSNYALLNGTYYIGYVAFLVPGSLLGKRTKPNIVMAVAAMCWGTMAALTAATTTWAGASGVRLLVGVFEAGFGPVIPFYIARWYMRKELGFRMALWQGTAQISGVINGLLSYGLAQASNLTFAPWKLLYIIEGVATVFFAAIAIFILPGHPSRTKILKAEEQRFAVARKAAETGRDSANIKWKHVIESLYDLRLILPTITYGIAILTGAVISAFLPTLIVELGYSGAIAQIMTLPCYLSAMLMIGVTSWASDRFRSRASFIVVGFAFSIVGFAMLLAGDPSQTSLRYAALVFAQIGNANQTVPIPLHLTWVAENAGNETKKAVHIGLMVAVAQALAIASGYIFPASQSPRYTQGTSICLALAILGGIVVGLHRYLLNRENKRRDAVEGPLTGVVMETGELAEKAIGWRFQL